MQALIPIRKDVDYSDFSEQVKNKNEEQRITEALIDLKYYDIIDQETFHKMNQVVSSLNENAEGVKIGIMTKDESIDEQLRFFLSRFENVRIIK